MLNCTEIFLDYPDVVSTEQLQEMLGISRNLAYKFLKENDIAYRKVGREFRINKQSVIAFFNSQEG